MRIGLDLDGTVYGFPKIFREIILAHLWAGHRLYCTSNHLRKEWESDKRRLRVLGIPADRIDPRLMRVEPFRDGVEGARHKAWMADKMDLVYDDDAVHFQHLTKTPVMKVPKIRENGNLRHR